jgi:hypothetical protein
MHGHAEAGPPARWRLVPPGLPGRPGRPALLGLVVLLALSACGTVASTPKHDLPGGVYTNAPYHFRIAYPQGWQVNVSPARESSAISPVTVLITRSGELQANGSLVSTFTIIVLSTGAAPVATAVARLRKDPSVHALTLSGMPAYQAAPVQQPIPNTQFSDTHTDYFLIHGGYEYQLSTDAVQGDNASAALEAMLQSFTILA